MPDLQTAISDANLKAADLELRLTKEERALYARHLDMLARGGYKWTEGPNEGKTSTLYVGDEEINGRVYLFPTIYPDEQGRPMPIDPREALRRAVEGGIEQFPSYRTRKEALDRYDEMHRYMDRDTTAGEEDE